MTSTRKLVLSLLLVAFTIVIYWPVRQFEFINYDDDEYITNNTHVQQGLTTDNIRWAFTTLAVANWHPLAWLSHMLDVQMFGWQNAPGESPSISVSGKHHLVNVFWHTANALLIFCILGWMTGAWWRGWIVAGLFALHPLHVESVAWVAERKDVLSTFFGLLAILAYVSWVKRGRWWRYALVMLAFALSLLAKPMLVTLPFVLLLLDIWPLRRTSISPGVIHSATGTSPLPSAKAKRNSTLRPSSPRDEPIHRFTPAANLVLEKLPLLAMTLASAAITVLAQSRGGAVESIEHVTLAMRLGNALISYATYLVQMVAPLRLAVLYAYTESISGAWVIGACALLASITIGAVVLRRNNPAILIGWLWFLGTLVPVIGLVQVGIQSHADRYTYVPLIGLFMAAVWLVPSPRNSSMRWLTGVAAAVALACCGMLTAAQLQHWRNNFSLYTHALAVTSRNSLAHHNLGVAYIRSGQEEQGVAELQAALEIRPNYPQALKNLASIYIKRNDPTAGVPMLEQAVRIKPVFAEAHADLGAGYLLQGRRDLAAEQYQIAIAQKPDLLTPRVNYGSLLLTQQRYEDALVHLRAAVAIKPSDANAHYYLGLALANLGQAPQAIEHLQQAVQFKPDLIDARFNLAKLQEDLGRFDQAIANYGEILRLKPDHAPARSNLARAQMRKGDLAGAIATGEQVIRQSPTDPMAYNNLARLLVTAADPKLRDPGRALQLADRACELTSGTDPLMLTTLAMAQAASGRFDQAITVGERALSLAQSSGQQQLAEDLRNRLALYRAGKTQ